MVFSRYRGCNFASDRYNGPARCQASVVMVTPSVPPQRLPVNLVRSGRKQPQREHCVPGCGWWGYHLNALLLPLGQSPAHPLCQQRLLNPAVCCPPSASRSRVSSAVCLPPQNIAAAVCCAFLGARKRHSRGNDQRCLCCWLFLALRLGQGVINRCDQLSQILWGGFVYDTE